MKYFTLFPLQGYWGKWAGGAIAFLALLAGALVIGLKMPVLDGIIQPKLQEAYLMWFLAIGLLLLTFSKERVDDERVQRIRYVAFRGASMFGFMFTLFMLLPANWDSTTGDAVLLISDVPIAILFCVITPLIIFQVVFNLGLYLDSHWAYNDLDAEANLRKNPWLLVFGLVVCACLLGMIAYGMLSN